MGANAPAWALYPMCILSTFSWQDATPVHDHMDNIERLKINKVRFN